MAMHGEHAALRVTFARLRASCAAPADENALGGLGLHVLIDELREQLRAHFAAEEAGDYFGTLEADCPVLRPRIALLRAEHAEMFEAIKALHAACRQMNRRADMAADLERLWERLQAHEDAESQLIQEFFLPEEAG